MQYSEVKTLFTSILNRRDITPSQITQFIQMGIQSIQRKLRVPPMEKQVAFTSDGTADILIPADFLEVISLYSDNAVDTIKLEKRDLQTVLKASKLSGTPRYYCRIAGSTMRIGPTPAAGYLLYLTYWADSSVLSADTDTNWMTDAAPDLIAYAALVYAADFFLDDRKDVFEARFSEIINDLQDMANRDELDNASISPVYPDQIEALY